MITAKEALAITTESAKREAVKKYEPMIRKAAEKGERSIHLDRWLPHLEINALKGFGYTISENDREYASEGGTIISW